MFTEAGNPNSLCKGRGGFGALWRVAVTAPGQLQRRHLQCRAGGEAQCGRDSWFSSRFLLHARYVSKLLCFAGKLAIPPTLHLSLR